jgi:alkyl sulfatase BDS1-like metallo-beta-lactamase superfamily hydrolase
LASGETQWAAQRCDHLLALDPSDKKVMLLKADALNLLAEALLTATGRNFYLSDAEQLRVRASADTR